MYLLAIAAGAVNPVQAGANSELKKSLNQALYPAIAVYSAGLLGVLIIQLFIRQPWPGAQRVAETPWWAWLGGFVSIASTLAGITFALKMGSGVFTGISVTSALVASVVLDHFGLVGFKVHPASWPRVLGCALMIAGVWIVSKVG